MSLRLEGSECNEACFLVKVFKDNGKDDTAPQRKNRKNRTHRSRR